MSIQTELTRITNAKAAIKTAVEGKGVTVPDGTLLDGMAALIESIETGGGAKISTGEFYNTDTTISSDTFQYSIEHGLGKTPDFAIVVACNPPTAPKQFAAAMFVANGSFSGNTKQVGLSYFASSTSTNSLAETKPSVAKHIYSEFGCIADETYINIYGDKNKAMIYGRYSWIAGVLT